MKELGKRRLDAERGESSSDATWARAIRERVRCATGDGGAGEGVVFGGPRARVRWAMGCAMGGVMGCSMGGECDGATLGVGAGRGTWMGADPQVKDDGSKEGARAGAGAVPLVWALVGLLVGFEANGTYVGT